MNHLLNKKVLATTNNLFYAPDGKRYNAVYGTLIGVHQASKTLGFIPNRSHANWYYEIGSMIIMGCQILYLIECPKPISIGPVWEWTITDDKVKEYERPTSIYITD